LGFAPVAGYDEVDEVFTVGLVGLPWPRVSFLSSLSFPFSDPSTSVFGSLYLVVGIGGGKFDFFGIFGKWEGGIDEVAG
jgi:hypothetical protein